MRKFLLVYRHTFSYIIYHFVNWERHRWLRKSRAQLLYNLSISITINIYLISFKKENRKNTKKALRRLFFNKNEHFISYMYYSLKKKNYLFARLKTQKKEKMRTTDHSLLELYSKKVFFFIKISMCIFCSCLTISNIYILYINII